MSDEWETPLELYKELHREFDFILDACSTHENKKADYRLEDATQPWEDQIDEILPEYAAYSGIAVGSFRKVFIEDVWESFCEHSVFMNPPYSNPKQFIERAWEHSQHQTVVCLVPNTIVTCKYMDFLFEPSTFRKPKPGLEIRYLSRRTNFTHPTKKTSSPSFGCMLLIMNRA